MFFSTKMLTGAIAGLTLMFGATAAMAAPAVATGAVNVRTGPSTSYRVVDTLRRGERVDIRRCRGGWCFITHRGPDGWVSGNYLARRGYNRPPVIVNPPPVIVRPPIIVRPPHYRPPVYRHRDDHRRDHRRWDHRRPDHRNDNHQHSRTQKHMTKAQMCRANPRLPICKPGRGDQRPNSHH